MSLFGALYASVAGLDAQSNSLGIISDNIANSNTIGYKEGSASFQTLVTNSSTATSGSYSPGGVLSSNQQLVSSQGLLQTTSSPTDIAISGAGLFVVNQKADQTGQVLYTRAGSFTPDSNGNFVNSAGLYLQAWPLDRDGALPGTPGNPDTTSSANISSLQTVNVENLTGAASATTSVAFGANLDASQAIFAGAGQTTAINAGDAANIGISADQILVPDSTNGLAKGGQLQVNTSSNYTYNYTYGGFSYTRDVSAAAGSSDYGDSDAPVAAAFALNTAQTLTFDSSDPTSVTINSAAIPTGLQAGDVITLAGASATDVDGLTGLNGTYYVTALVGPVGAPTGFTIQLPTTATAPAPQLITTAATFSVGTAVALGPTTITMTLPSAAPNTMAMGDTIELTNAPDLTGTGISGADLDAGPLTVASVSGDTVTFTIPTGSSGTTGSPIAAASNTTLFDDNATLSSATATTRQFTGDILNASGPTQEFLGTVPTTDFTDASLNFTIDTPASGTTTFQYTSAAPISTQGAAVQQFNNLTNLVTAINNVTGLTARLVTVDGATRLYVGATDANDPVTFANGSTTGSTDGTTVKSGIDWVGELGLQDIPSGTNTFSTLQGLSDQVNASTGLSSTVNDPAGASTVSMNLDDPLSTITFSDVSSSGLLTELGLLGTAQGPSYDPTDPTKNMASGTIPPQFSHPVTVFDSLGTAHTLNVAFLKTSGEPATWAVEIYSQPSPGAPAEVTSSLPNGLIASGTVIFNGDGTLESVSSSLSQPITINWTDGAQASSITYNWGTAGPVGTGKANGLGQYDSDFSAIAPTQNGAPVGQLTGVAIDSSGIITASYSNGETQQLYQIPIASFSDSDGLQSVDGNAYSQTSSSGEVNLKQAGSSGVGTISSGSLEQSNVDVATQLTNMIIAQQAYQANSKVVQTVDTLLQDLNQVIQ